MNRRKRCRCCKQLVITMPRVEDQSRNGVRVRVLHYPGGTVVDADCSCFGMPKRVHNNERCPRLLAARKNQRT